MNMGNKMTTDSHSICPGRSHKEKKQDAKANGLWKQMNDEVFEREKDEIIVHIELLMELLQWNTK